MQSQPPPAREEQSRYLSDIIQSWGFAKQSNDEGLFCAIVAVLALLLKTISSFVDFREHGNYLCETILQEDQIKLLERGFNAVKIKGHVVSPCLRLLTEIVSFDGGAAAQNVYTHRDTTFKRLHTLLGMRKEFSEAVPENKRRNSVRNNALWYLYANLKLQSRNTKSNILSDAKIIQAVFHDIKKDSAPIVLEILNAFRKDVVQDSALSHLVKGRLFTDWTLQQIASLYQLPERENNSDEITQVRHEVHAFLLHVCSTKDQGILRLQHAADHQDEPVHNNDQFISDAVTIVTKSRKQGLVRNVTLASFLQSLRPYADILQCDLIIAVFQAAPDLIADYFVKKSFPFEPKLTITWVGYSMFLLSTIQLPIPREQLSQVVSGQSRAPLPVYSMIESILPQPLTKKALTRCLNQSADLITFFAIRILIAAFQKLANTLETLASANELPQFDSASLWKQAQVELVDEFRRRCPEMKHVIAVFRTCSSERALFREAITSLLAMYYKLLPQIALEEKLDISTAISDLLKRNSWESNESQSDKLRKLELYNLLEIARRSPDMGWWRKPGALLTYLLISMALTCPQDDMLLSPFTTILRLHITNPKTVADDRIRILLRYIIADTTVLKPNTSIESINILLLSLQDPQRGHASDSLFKFLDNCLLRCLRKPVKYYDDLTALVLASNPNIGKVGRCNIDLLLVTILDQWPYIVKPAPPVETEETIRWLVRYLDLSMHAGSDVTVLSKIRDQITLQVTDKVDRALLKEALREPSRYVNSDELKDIDGSRQDKSNHLAIHHSVTYPSSHQESLVPGIPLENEDHPGLRKWMQRDVPQAIKDGEVGELVLCLCSKHEDIRKQAIIALRTFAGRLKVSGSLRWSNRADRPRHLNIANDNRRMCLLGK